MASPQQKKSPVKRAPASAPAKQDQDALVAVDWNNPEFQRSLIALPKAEQGQVLKTVGKIMKLSWSQLYRDTGLNWEEVTSKPPPPGLDKWYSLRVSLSRRAMAYREGNFLRFLVVEPDHDAAYGKK